MTVSKRVIIAAAFFAAVSLVLGSASPSAALAAGSRIVDDDFGMPGACPGANFATIQAAVNNIAPGKSGAIKVCAGIYFENVSMTGLGKVTLQGKPGAIIAPLAAAPLIAAMNTTRLTVQGFTLDAAGNGISPGMLSLENSSGIVTKNVFQNSTSSTAVYSAVTAGMASLKVTNNDFNGIGSGVYAFSGSALSAKVTGNDFTGVIEGVGVNAAPGASAAVSVTGNHLQGPGGVGISVQGANKARVTGNTIQGFGVGINLRDSNRTTVSKNKVRSTSYGIRILSSAANASFNKITGNTIEAAGGNFIGVFVTAGAGMAANFNQIKGNTITDPGALYASTDGVFLTTSSGSIDKTTVKSNKVINMDLPYYHTGDTNTVIGGNKCSPAAPCIP